MDNLEGQLGEVRMVVEITRLATGKTETMEIIGKVGEVLPAPAKEEDE